MMSTTGRSPVIAAPIPRPVMPGSEIGESSTRSVPNSSTRPASTLKGVPASATSSPITKTASSRRSSSVRASLIACAKVSVRVSPGASTLGEDILGHLTRVGKGRLDGEREPDIDLGTRPVLDALQVTGRGEALLLEPRSEERERVTFASPQLFFLFRPVVGAIDVAHVMAVIAVRVAEEEGRAASLAGALDELGGVRVDGTRVLTVDFARFDPERTRPREDVARRDLEVVGVLVVLVVLADVDHWQPPERGHVHHLVDEPLAERALSEEAHRDLVGAAPFCRERGAGRDSGGAADDRVRAEIAVLVIGDVHRAALPAAVTRLLAEQLGEHATHLRPLGETVTVAAVRGRDPVLAAEGCAHADRDRLLADVEMCETGHLRASIQLVRLLLEQADQ